jgi:hypothetical protein
MKPRILSTTLLIVIVMGCKPAPVAPAPHDAIDVATTSQADASAQQASSEASASTRAQTSESATAPSVSPRAGLTDDEARSNTAKLSASLYSMSLPDFSRMVSDEGFEFCKDCPADYPSANSRWCKHFAREAIDETIYRKNIRPAIGPFVGQNALEWPRCRNDNGMEICDSNRGPDGAIWSWTGHGAERRIVKIRHWCYAT